MEVVPGDPVVPVIWDEYKKILNEPVETGCVQVSISEISGRTSRDAEKADQKINTNDT